MFINYESDSHVYPVTVEYRDGRFYVTYDNNEYTISAEEVSPGQLKLQLGDRYIKAVISERQDSKFVFIDGEVFQVARVELTGKKKAEKKEGDLNSPISGTIVSIKVKPGDSVVKGDVLMVIEAMKMEYLIRAPATGTIEKVFFKEKDQIEIGQLTAELRKKEA
jgi:3-methylcrotonyl-CoA carboxylase alpha subunit